MEIVKELSEIAEKWTEPEYRARPELSYSNISTYENLGFSNLEHLFDRKETPSLTLGSVVDCLTTGSLEEFNSLYTIIDIDVTDGGKDTCSQLLSMNLPFSSFEEIPESVVSSAAKAAGFWQADKWDNTRYKQVLKTGNIAEYYNAMLHSDKILISNDVYQTALAMVNAFKTAPATSGYFADDDPFTPIRRYYQLKFKATIEGVGYRCMMDLAVVDYDKKIIYPCDIKTSSTPEWEFEKNFIKWHYLIQALMYYNILKQNVQADPYFKDFEIKDYKFLVVNAKTLTPLVWEFPLTKMRGPFIDDEGTVWPDPFALGKELRGYLDCKPPVPNGISIDGVNTIKCLRVKD